jgi:hypothetical protein
MPIFYIRDSRIANAIFLLKQTNALTLGPYVETHGARDVCTFEDELRANMKFTPAHVCELATNTRFPAGNLEKVLRVARLFWDPAA